MENTMLVVGDQYADFCTSDSTITLSKFDQIIDAGEAGETQFVLGLGLDHECVGKIPEFQQRGINVMSRENLAALKTTHKHFEKNILISEPYKASEGRYTMELMLNDEQDRLIDHVTGKHVSGMALVEAARQACIACSEIEIDIFQAEKSLSFVWNNMDVSFDRFAFPLPTKISVDISVEDMGKSKKSMETRVLFTQENDVVCTIKNYFEVVPSRVLNHLENRSADALIKKTVESVNKKVERKCAA